MFVTDFLFNKNNSKMKKQIKKRRQNMKPKFMKQIKSGRVNKKLNLKLKQNKLLNAVMILKF